MVHLHDIFQISWTRPTSENTLTASLVRVKGVPAKAFNIMLKALKFDSYRYRFKSLLAKPNYASIFALREFFQGSSVY